MELNLSTLLVFATGLLSGIVAALKIIAPLTKNKVDDKIEEYAEKALDLLPVVKSAPSAPSTSPRTSGFVGTEAQIAPRTEAAPSGAKVRDHR